MKLIVAAFYECLITIVMTLLRTTAAQKRFLYYSLLLGTIKLLNYDLLFTNICNLIYFMYTFTMVSPLSSMMRFFPKKFFMRFFGVNFWGGTVVHGVVTIKPSQDRQSFINAFCNKLNIANHFPNCVRMFSPDQNYGRIYAWVIS